MYTMLELNQQPSPLNLPLLVSLDKTSSKFLAIRPSNCASVTNNKSPCQCNIVIFVAIHFEKCCMCTSDFPVSAI